MAGAKICDAGVTTGLTQAEASVSGYGKPLALTLLASFTTTGGGASCKGWVQTSLDGGATWVDIACFAFGASSAVKYANLNLMQPAGVAVPTSGALADDAVLHGLMGDMVRVLRTSTGAYNAGSKLEIWMQPRG